MFLGQCLYIAAPGTLSVLDKIENSVQLNQYYCEKYNSLDFVGQRN